MLSPTRFPAVLAACAVLACAVLAPGCSSESLELTLEVTATPNPATGTGAAADRRWDYEISIANPTAVGVRMENFHVEISDTDTGFELPLIQQDLKNVPEAELWIASGGTLSYSASTESEGKFASGRERRIFHALGDDGVYYSGEVVISLQ